jgi:hypothetical protein
MWRRPNVTVRLIAGSALCLLLAAARAEAQFGALVSPGPLAKAHAAFEGASNCQKCHERGRKVTPEKCLTCHAPIARRIQENKGVHRGVAECVSCHVDHAGVDGELRPFDVAKFDHATVTGFALDGKHAPFVTKCESCHKVRSFLTTSPACTACHQDVHKGSLGQKCEKCHPTSMAFKDAKTSFDHTVTVFPLLGAHHRVECAKCHTGQTFKVAKFAACMDCHPTPHPKAIATACASCHSNDNWKTKKFDHTRTAFPLRGQHATVDCEGCHKASAVKVKPPSATCAACHADTHRGEFKQDCKACHTETGFANAPFDHQASTAAHFALVDGHGRLTCQACHTMDAAAARLPAARKVVDFRGLKTLCASCHADAHQGELGPACDTCHSVRSFKVTAFKHPRFPELFTGQHAPVACADCHKPAAGATPARAAGPGPAATSGGRAGAAAPRAATVLRTKFKAAPTACVSCHADPHLGQVTGACESCHSVEAPKFGADRFAHDRSKFRLAGKHQGVECDKCHKRETAAFPAGRGTALRLTGLAMECRACHADVHLGQVSTTCDTCHSVDTFKLMRYEHRKAPADFFVGSHKRAKCDACHKTVTGAFPAGHGTAVRFAVETTCVACHTDVHHGTLGGDCRACHKPEPLPAAHLVVRAARPEWARSGVRS